MKRKHAKMTAIFITAFCLLVGVGNMYTTWAASSTKVSSVLQDDKLFETVLNAYNTQHSGNQKNESNFTYDDLKTLSGKLDLSDPQITSIPANAFTSCNLITEVQFSDTLTSIGKSAFEHCQGLTTVNLPDSLKVLGESAFFDCGLVTLNETNTIPANLTEIGNNVFGNNPSLKEVILISKNGSVYKNATGLFAGCTGLTSITIGNGITVLPVDAFKNAANSMENSGLSVTFGQDLTTLLANSFDGVKLKEESVLDFSQCKNLSGIASDAFKEATNLTTVILPATTDKLEFGDSAFAKTELVSMYPSDSESTDGVYLPDYVTKVGNGCFYSDKSLTAVSLSPSLEVLPDYLFDYCTALASVEQRTKDGSCAVKEIGDCAFRGTAITNTDFLLEMDQLTTIGYQHIADDNYSMGNGVWDCDNNGKRKDEEEKISTLPLGGEGDTSNKVTMNATTKQKTYKSCPAGSEVFSDCYSLKSVTIPASVTSIGSRAFYHYPRNIDKLADNSGKNPSIQTIEWKTSDVAAERIVWPGAFQGNISLTSCILPDCSGDQLDIRAYAFARDTKMTIVKGNQTEVNTLPATIINLSKGAFYHCEALPSIVIQNIEKKDDKKVEEAPTLGSYLFEHCIAMKKAELPANVTEIPDHCFYDVPLTSYSIGTDNKNVDQITRIGTLAFLGNNFTAVDLSNYTSLEEIAAGAFAFIDAVDEKGEECVNSKTLKSPFDANGSIFGLLKKVILPDSLESLYLNSAPFYGQFGMTTLTTNDALKKYGNKGVEENVFYVPAYITVNEARAVFGATGVSKTIWQVDIDSSVDQKNQWKTIPVLLYANCFNITNATDVLPVKDYVEKIGKGAFYASGVQVADLSLYTALTEIGSGKLSGSEGSYTGVFANCLSLETVKLPTKKDGEKLVVGEQTFMKRTNDSLTDDEKILNKILNGETLTIDELNNSKNNVLDSLVSVDLGGATELGQNAFTGSFVLKEITIPDTIPEIKNSTFKNCLALNKVDFGSVTKIGDSAFLECRNLNLGNGEEAETIGLPETLVTIETNAFKDAGIQATNGLGTAIFGSELTTISESAFESSALKKVNFDKAQKLETMSKKAFYKTQLQEFVLNNTKVKKVESQVLAGCANLTTVELGAEVETVVSGAIRGCPKLNKFTFAPTTLVNAGVFSGKEQVGGEQKYTSQDASDTIAVIVNAPDTTVVAAERDNVVLPFYIFAEKKSNFKDVLIETEDGSEDENVKEYLKLHAKLSDGYYWHKKQKGSKYAIDANSDYYEALSDSKTTKWNGNTVDVITMDTSSLTGKFKLSVTSQMEFELTSDKKINPSFTTTYNIEVQDLPYYPVLYKQREGSNPYKYDQQIENNLAIQAVSGDGKKEYYYQLDGTDEAKKYIECYDIVVKTDNPQVVFPGTSNAKVGDYKTDEGYSPANTTDTNKKTAKEGNMKFYLIPTGTGTATITMYPKGHEDWITTFTVTVNSDIKSIKLAVPDDYKNGAIVGNTFNVFSEFTNYYGVTVNAENLAAASTASNQVITYTSNAPEYVSVDGNGQVTILKADAKDKNVNITATVENTPNAGSRKTANVTVKIKGDPTATTTQAPTTQAPTTEKPTTNPSGNKDQGNTNSDKKSSVRTGQTVEDAASGTTVKVTKVAENGAGGEVAITTINNKNATKVSIPTTVMVEGVPYQVTEISSNLCSGFKKLKTVAIPASVKKIGDGAFQNCKKLKKVVIPKGVESIGSNAFYGCKSLKLITVKSTVLKSVGSNAFYGIHKKAKIKVPKKKYKVYKSILSNKGQKKSVKIKK